MTHTNFPTASAALQQLATGELRAVPLLEQCLARIGHHNPAINALITLDLPGARAQARRADELRDAGHADGMPLLGLPISVKDAFTTRGLRTTSGSPRLCHHLPTHDASAVARLKAAGAVLIGKSNLAELAGNPQCWNPLFGHTRNPWQPELTPGGSSGGSAAAIAMGFSLLELGSDIAGSIRIPAAFCGVAGLKATENRIPQTGHIPPLPGQERGVRHMLSFGLLARCVADLQLGLPVIAGPDGVDSEVPPVASPTPWPARPLRIAWWDDFGGLPLCHRTRRGLAEAVTHWQRAGHVVERLTPIGFDIQRAWHAFGVILGAETGSDMPWPARLAFRAAATALPVRQAIARGVLRGRGQSMAAYQAALCARDELIALLEQFLHQWDVWVCPVASRVAYSAFPLSAWRPPPALSVDGQRVPYIEATVGLTAPFSLTGHPIVSLPVAVMDDLPVGLQIVGRRWHDETLLAHCLLLEAVLDKTGKAPS